MELTEFQHTGLIEYSPCVLLLTPDYVPEIPEDKVGVFVAGEQGSTIRLLLLPAAPIATGTTAAVIQKHYNSNANTTRNSRNQHTQ